MATYTADEILAYFDRLAERYEFPTLDDGVSITGAVRLTAYRDEERWAVLVEDLCFWYGSSEQTEIVTVIHRLGNCVERPVLCNDGVGGMTFLDGEDQPVRLIEGEDWTAITAVIRGRPVPFPWDAFEYEARDIPRNMKSYEPEPYEVMWFLLPEHREAMLATEDELRRHVPAGLPFFLRLDEWLHPLVGETPSQNETFRKLAEALAHGDPNRFIPPATTNTHWKNWLGT
jgi:hypothetical protein